MGILPPLCQVCPAGGGFVTRIGENSPSRTGRSRPPRWRPRGVCSRQGAGPARMHPPCRRRKVRSAPFPPAAKTAPAPLLLLSPPRGARRGSLIGLARKENGPCTVQREKTLRRVGLRLRRPPAAGGGWLAVPRGSQGRKRVALGVTFGPGKSGIHPAPLFAAAGPVVDGASATGR